MRPRAPNILAATVLVLALATGGRASLQAQSTNTAAAAVAPAARPLENGAYAVLREGSTPQEVGAAAPNEVVLAYDRRRYSGAPPNEPLTWIVLDRKDYLPLIIQGRPDMKSDGQGKSILMVSLVRTNVARAEAFTKGHLGGRMAMVIGGEIVTLHKVRTVITDGKLQITRCTDNACEVLRSKLVQ